MRISGKGVSACRAPAGMKFITSWYEDGARSMDERAMSSGLEELEQLHASGAVRHLYPPAPHIADDKKLGRAWKPPRVRAMAACSQGLLATSGAEQWVPNSNYSSHKPHLYTHAAHESFCGHAWFFRAPWEEEMLTKEMKTFVTDTLWRQEMKTFMMTVYMLLHTVHWYKNFCIHWYLSQASTYNYSETVT